MCITYLMLASQHFYFIPYKIYKKKYSYYLQLFDTFDVKNVNLYLVVSKDVYQE